MGPAGGLRSLVDRCLGSLKRRLRAAGSETPATPAEKALGWLAANQAAAGGIRVHSRRDVGYPEVTGYLVPTLVDRRQWPLAERLVQWLIRVQRADGSFPDPDRGVAYVFDTAQALRGLLAAADRLPAAADAAVRAAEYIAGRMIDHGRGGFARQFEHFQAPTIQETILLYVLPPLVRAAAAFGQPAWRTAADRCSEFYLDHPQLLDANRLTHFLAYELEALVDLGRPERAQPLLDRLAEAQRDDGAVRATGNDAWVCVPGLAQLAVCWYKTGRRGPADRALAWLCSHQRPSGGFCGSAGRRATYFPRQEISWAVKYFLDADLLQSASR
jgi:malonyl-CoA O-methyltransferase